MVDVKVENYGSLFLFRPHTETADKWLKENIGEESTYFGPALVVEPRYARDLAQGMIDAGLNVE